MNTATAQQDPNRFYVYGLFDRGIPFYIGKGSGRRYLKHMPEAKRGSKFPVHCKIRSLDYKYETRILAPDLTEEESLDLEELVIRVVGRKCTSGGTLMNLHEGGVGGSPCEETRKKMSERMKGTVPTQEVRAKISAALKGRVKSAETREKLSIAHKGLRTGCKLSEEHKAKIGAAGKGRVCSPETRAKIGAKSKINMLGKKASLETRMKMSESRKGRKLSKEHVAKAVAGRLGYSPSEDTRKKISATLTGRKVKITLVTCPHCDKEGWDNAMRRWHFNNCKFKKEDSK